jgi:hypothetical protein
MPLIIVYLMAIAVLIFLYVRESKSKKANRQEKEKPVPLIIMDYRRINARIQSATDKTELDKCLSDINDFAAHYSGIPGGAVTLILLDNLNVKLHGGELQAVQK